MGRPWLQVDVYKPVTSKANNSETYLMGFGFRGIADSLLTTLLKHVGDTTFEETTMLPQAAMPPAFVRSVADCGKFFAERTKDSLEDAYTRRSPTPLVTEILRDSQMQTAEDWLRKNFQVKPLDPAARLSVVRTRWLHQGANEALFIW